MFGDDAKQPAAPAAPTAPIQPKKAAEKKKPKAVAKSIVVIDIKVYEQEQDLHLLAQKIIK